MVLVDFNDRMKSSGEKKLNPSRFHPRFTIFWLFSHFLLRIVVPFKSTYNFLLTEGLGDPVGTFRHSVQ